MFKLSRVSVQPVIDCSDVLVERRFKQMYCYHVVKLHVSGALSVFSQVRITEAVGSMLSE